MEHRHLGVDLNGGVVVDRARRRQHAAVPMIGELIEADIGHDQAFVADLLAYGTDRGRQDAIGIEGSRAARILAFRYAEQHDACEARVRGLDRRLAERVHGVLDDPGHGADRTRLMQTLGDEHGQDQLARLEGGLGHHLSHSCSGPQTPGPMFDCSRLFRTAACDPSSHSLLLL